jgi:hypothetical protein
MINFNNLKKDFINQIVKQKLSNINNNYCKKTLVFLHTISRTNMSSKQKSIVINLVSNFSIKSQELTEEEIFKYI